MKVLLTGASGLLGTWLLRTVPDGIDVTAVVHTSEINWPQVARSDLRDPQEARRVIGQARPDLVVHAAYQRDFASIVDLTTNVGAAARTADADIVMVSTDAVFSGDGTPRSETDKPDPVWDYGRWKARAERIVLHTDPNATIVRLPLLVSVDPSDGMAERILSAVAQNATVSWYKEERRQPAYASDVARALWQIVRLPAEQRAGFWHLPGAERLTRRQLGARIAQALDVDDPGIESEPPEQRPHDVVLTGRRARDQLQWQPQPIDDSYPLFPTPRSRDLPA